jgi:hypothetical protein
VKDEEGHLWYSNPNLIKIRVIAINKEEYVKIREYYKEPLNRHPSV